MSLSSISQLAATDSHVAASLCNAGAVDVLLDFVETFPDSEPVAVNCGSALGPLVGESGISDAINRLSSAAQVMQSQVRDHEEPSLFPSMASDLALLGCLSKVKTNADFILANGGLHELFLFFLFHFHCVSSASFNSLFLFFAFLFFFFSFFFDSFVLCCHFQ